MLIDVINSGSDGNCYVIKCKDEYLIIECGVPAKDMLRSIDFQTLKVSGCVVSHGHA